MMKRIHHDRQNIIPINTDTHDAATKHLVRHPFTTLIYPSLRDRRVLLVRHSRQFESVAINLVKADSIDKCEHVRIVHPSYNNSTSKTVYKQANRLLNELYSSDNKNATKKRITRLLTTNTFDCFNSLRIIDSMIYIHKSNNQKNIECYEEISTILGDIRRVVCDNVHIVMRSSYDF